MAWAVSYIILLVLPIFAGLVIYSYMFGVVKEEITRSNQMMVQNMQRETDSILGEVERIYAQVAIDRTITELLGSQLPVDSELRYGMSDAAQNLSVYVAQESAISEFYIMIPSLDYCITPTASRPISDYFLHYRGMSMEDMNQIKNAVLSAPGSHIFSRSLTDSAGVTRETIVLAQTLPLGEKQVLGAAVVEISQNELLSAIEENAPERMGKIYILDKNNQLIPGTGDPDIDVTQLLSDEEIEKKTIQGTNLYVIQSRSASSGWRYISVVTDDVFMARMHKPLAIVLLMAAVYILIAGIAGAMLLRRNYQPFSNLLAAVRERTGAEFDQEGKIDEYAFIEQALSKVVTEKEHVDTFLRQQKNVLRRNFLERLLQGNIHSSIPVEESLEAFQIPVVSHRAVVVLLSPEDVEQLFAEESTLTAEKRQELAMVILENIFTEIASRHGSAFGVVIDEFLACCILLREEDLPRRRKLLDKDLDECAEVVQSNFEFEFLAAISEVHDLEEGMDIAYKEALTAMEYKIINQETRRIWYADLQEKQQSGYYYPLEKERQIIYLVRSGNKEEAEAVLEEVFQRNFESDILPMQLVRCLMFDIASTMIKTIQEVFGDHQEEFLDSLKPVDRIMRCDNIRDLRAVVSDILSTVCEYVEQQEKNKICSKVEQFVQENYSNTNLSVAGIADYLKVHPGYVSTSFKKQTGMRLLDYISEVRIEKAKVLLRETGHTIEEISGAVGYASPGTFMRVFKKMEGVTPTQFRSGVRP